MQRHRNDVGGKNKKDFEEPSYDYGATAAQRANKPPGMALILKDMVERKRIRAKSCYRKKLPSCLSNK